MKRKIVWATGLLGLGIAGLIAFDRFRCAEHMYSYYPVYADAVADGALNRGWVPSIIPASATEIHEEHDLDTNQVWIRFRMPPIDRAGLTSGMRQLSNQEVQALRVRQACTGDWWFEGLIEQQPANDAALNAEIYVGTLSSLGWPHFVAIQRAGSLVYYWSDPGRESGVNMDGR